MSDERFLGELRGALVAAARTHLGEEGDGPGPVGTGGTSEDGGPAPVGHLDGRGRPRRYAVLLTAAAAVVLVVVGAVLFRGSSAPASADVEVIRQGDDLLVRLTDLRNRPEEIEAAAREAGIDLRISEAPVGPSNVGRFVTAEGTEPPREIQVDAERNNTFTGFRIPVGWDAPVHLVLGRPAREGEEYVITSDALTFGEPLECRPLLGLTVTELRRELGEGWRVRWETVTPTGTRALAPWELDRFGSWRAVSFEAVRPDELWVQLTEDGSSPFVTDDLPGTRLSPDC